MTKGMVTLVGAGPGDPELLTLAGRTALRQAEVVLYDRLANPAILAHAPASAVCIDVGKRKGNHPVPQTDINRLLLDHALAGKRVVRLKDGDPYLFGRGAEELAGLAAAGMPFRVIPGVTSAIAGPACAGIPVTHRDLASSVHIFTGHGKDGDDPDIPYAAAAALGGTLVFLMGLTTVDSLCDGLVAAGMAADTPAAMVSRASLPDQRRVAATLATLPVRVREAGLASPAVLVVGEVCRLADGLDWFGRLSLHGKRILTVSSGATAARLASLLRDRGAWADEFAGITRRPLPVSADLWDGIDGYAWVAFTSEYGVERFFEELPDVRRIGHARFAAIGSRTAAALVRHGIRPDCVPEVFDGTSLALAMADRVAPAESVLLFRAEGGGAELPAILTARGITVDEVASYNTIANPPSQEILASLEHGCYDAATFTSASAVAALPAECRLPELVLCIGDVTAAAVRGRGVEPAVSPAATLESMAEYLEERLGQHEPYP